MVVVVVIGEDFVIAKIRGQESNNFGVYRYYFLFYFISFQVKLPTFIINLLNEFLPSWRARIILTIPDDSFSTLMQDGEALENCLETVKVRKGTCKDLKEGQKRSIFCCEYPIFKPNFNEK